MKLDNFTYLPGRHKLKHDTCDYSTDAAVYASKSNC